MSLHMDNSVYSHTTRFDESARALTEDHMRRLAPSIFAVEAHASRSDRFRTIPTIEVLRALQNEGFSPVGVRQSNSRDESKHDFTKHLIRLRRLDTGETHRVGDTVCEIILKNANDGSSAYDLMAGLFRIRCLNSLVAQTATLDSVKVRHSGDALTNVIEGTYRVLGETQKLLAAPQDWSQIRVDRDAALALADSARVVRFGDAKGEVSSPITADQLLTVRREGDTGADLWTIFNRVQENVIRGGLSARAPATIENGRRVRGRRVTTREVTGIDQDVKLNKSLWILGERMAELLSSRKLAA
jgi:hypothetical protein